MTWGSMLIFQGVVGVVVLGMLNFCMKKFALQMNLMDVLCFTVFKPMGDFSAINLHFAPTLPETNIAPRNGWLEYDRFLFGWPIFRGVSGRVTFWFFSDGMALGWLLGSIITPSLAQKQMDFYWFWRSSGGVTLKAILFFLHGSLEYWTWGFSRQQCYSFREGNNL